MTYIKAIEIYSCSFPTKKPFSNHVRLIKEINGIYIRIYTDTNIIGNSFVYGLSIISHDNIIKHIKNDLIPELFRISNAVHNGNELHSLWISFWHSYNTNDLSHEKLYALANIDIAIWDIFTKTNNISLHQYLGAAKTKIPVYGTTGWLSLNENELIEECVSYLNKNIPAFKVRIGHKEDYSRLKALRNSVGSKVKLMLDANQRYSVEEAEKVANLLKEFDVLWLEEPTNNSLSNIEKIKKISPIPIALGENIISEHEFEIICKNNLTDYLQPDVPRCGGITGFHKIAHIALKYNIPICNHLLYELSISLIAAYPNGFMLEYDNFISPDLFTNEFSITDGCAKPSQTIGNGVELKKDALSTHSIKKEVVMHHKSHAKKPPGFFSENENYLSYPPNKSKAALLNYSLLNGHQHTLKMMDSEFNHSVDSADNLSNSSEGEINKNGSKFHFSLYVGQQAKQENRINQAANQASTIRQKAKL